MTMLPEFRVIIAGGRLFNNYDLMCQTADRILASKSKTHKITIVSGAAKGADTLGARYAQDNGYGLSTHYAIWETYGKSAGYIRNQEMADASDALIAYWDGQSRGTKHMIDIAEAKGMPTRIIKYS